MDTLFDSPFTPILVASLGVGFGLGALARLTAAPGAANLVAPAVFLVAYFETYQKVPAFPPVGSTNKIFYIAIAATLAGLVLDSVRGDGAAGRALHRLAWIAAPLLIALWIGWPRLAAPDAGLLAIMAALVLGGALVLWRLDRLASAAAANAGPYSAWILLALLPAVFAPIALFGGSSTSVGLCLGMTVGLGVAALIGLLAPRRLGLTAILGAGGGLLAVIDTVTLITRRTDLLALALFLTVPFAGQAGARFLLPAGSPGLRLRAVVIGVMAVSPIVVVLAVLFLRHENPLGN